MERTPAFPALLLLGSLKHHVPEEPGTKAAHKSLTATDSKFAKITRKSTTASINQLQLPSREIPPSHSPHPTTGLSSSQNLLISKDPMEKNYRQFQISNCSLWHRYLPVPHKLVIETFTSPIENHVFLCFFSSSHYCVQCRKRDLFLENVLGLPGLI